MIHLTQKLSFLLRAAGLAFGFLLASALPAQAQDYFPLEVGNTWLYKATTIVGTTPLALNITYQTVRVAGMERIGEQWYFNVSYFGRDVLLREASTGDILAYDRATGTETPWVALSLPVDGTFSSALDPCAAQGQIVSRDATAAALTEAFRDEIQVKFQGGCADAGVTTQYYAPNVGLIRQDENSFAGPVIYRLLYYRVGSRTATATDVSFTVAVEFPSYLQGTPLGARITFRNNGTDVVNLHFPSGQSFDLKILNDKGEAVYTWSRDKLFPTMVRDEKLGPGELTYGATAPLDGLPPGHYVLQGYLTTDPIVYSGQVPFDILAPTGLQ